MRRLFWLSVGAAAGYYAARKGSEVVEQARERGLVGNVTLVAGTASKVAASAVRAGAAVGSHGRSAPGTEPSPAPAPPPTPPPAGVAPSSTSPRSREVRP